VIFAAAMLIGVVSHAPGSLGVMEAAMFIGLPQFRKEELLASLLTFRVLYFVVPLLLAVLLLGLREFRIVVAGTIGRGGCKPTRVFGALTGRGLTGRRSNARDARRCS
jgi:hypothetical protein